ncbi:MAG: type II toxin-antitoxin system RatA family toxin [Gammaproteobacteria bacterium]|nr:type II toxin-antitoxin system RatA family toxin [Gammaproteobacteria bacterium]
MTQIHKNALVMHTPAEMYKLVNEVEFYPDFLPWCRSSRVIERNQSEQRATIEIAKGPLNKSFSTVNTMEEPTSIHMRLEEGPFESLDGRWVFQALGDKGCKISLDIEFEFSSRLMRAVLNPVFSEICSTLVDAFVKRADQVYRR